MTDKQQRARELVVQAYGEVTGNPRTSYWDRPVEQWQEQDQIAFRATLAALPDEQPAQGEVRLAIARIINPRFDRLCRDDESSAGAGTQGMVMKQADAILRLLAPPAGPAVEDAARELAELKAVLADPKAVHLNMLRGAIAKPSPADIHHIYGSELMHSGVVEQVRNLGGRHG